MLQVTPKEPSSKDVAGYKVVSFDLFDTLLIRRYLSYADIRIQAAKYAIGLIRGHNLFFTVEELDNLRSVTTSKLKKKFTGFTEEPPLRQVYQYLFMYAGLEEIEADKLSNSVVEFELMLEAANCHVCPEKLRVIEGLHEQGKRIVLSSDSYFSKKDVFVLLDKLCLVGFFERVYVSSECKVTKSSGKLFKYMLNDLEIKACEMIHIGDNYWNDYWQPKQASIASLWIGSKRLHKGYPVIESLDIEELVLLTALCSIYEISQYSQQNGLKRIYFLSRDATVLGDLTSELKIKQPIIGKILKDVEIRHLSVSRGSLVFLDFPHLVYDVREVLSRFLELNKEGYLLSELSKFLGIKFELASDVFVSQKSNLASVKALIVEEGEDFSRKLVDAVKCHSLNVRDYLIQEGVLNIGDRVGIVDIGYMGSCVKKIESYIDISQDFKDINRFDIHGFLVLSGNGFRLERNSLISYCKPLISSEKLPHILRLNYSWFEVFFQNRELGPLLGYKKINNVIEPIFKKPKEMASQQWMDGINDKVDFASLFSESVRLRVVEQFIGLMAKPNQEVVSKVSKLEFGHGRTVEESISIVAKDISVVKCIDAKYLKSLISQNIWISGSLRNKSFLMTSSISLIILLYFNLNRASKQIQNFRLYRKLRNLFSRSNN